MPVKRAAHRLRRHAGDKVAGRAGVGTQRRHRRHRARRRGVDDDGLRIGGAAGIAGQVGDRDLEIVIGAGRQRGVERPVAGHHSCRAEQRAAVKHLHAGNAGAAGVGNRAGKMHPAVTGDEVAVRGPAIAGQRHRRERLARRRGVERIAVAGARRGVVGRIDAAHRQRAGARRQRHPARRPDDPRRRRIHPGRAAIGAHLDLLARSQRAACRCRSPSAPPRW